MSTQQQKITGISQDLETGDVGFWAGHELTADCHITEVYEKCLHLIARVPLKNRLLISD